MANVSEIERRRNHDGVYSIQQAMYMAYDFFDSGLQATTLICLRHLQFLPKFKQLCTQGNRSTLKVLSDVTSCNF